MAERKQWFLNRIGKRVYRNHYGCPCDICKSGYETGVVIPDALSADYLYDMEASGNFEGNPLMYFDTIEQRDAFEKILKDYEIEPDTTVPQCIEGLTQKVGLKDASAIGIFQRIIKNYVKLKTISHD